MSEKKRIFITFFTFILSCCLAGVLFSCSKKTSRTRGGVDPLDTRTVRDRDRDDDDRRDRARTSTRTSRIGGGDCDGNGDCEEQCEDLFRGRDQKECLKLTANEVEGIYNAFEDKAGILAEPDEDDLDEVHPEDIRNALDIDDGIWTDLIDEYTSREAGHVLEWMADDQDIFDALGALDEEEDEESLLRDLFREFKSTVTSAMVGKLDDDDDDVFSVMAEGNEEAIEMAHEILLDDCLSDAGSKATSSAGYDNTGAGSSYNINNEDYKEQACSLGEVYCKKDGNKYIFEDVFEDIVDYDDQLEGYIDDELAAVSQSNIDDLDKVCPEFCKNFCRGSGGDPTGDNKPTYCDYTKYNTSPCD